MTKKEKAALNFKKWWKESTIRGGPVEYRGSLLEVVGSPKKKLALPGALRLHPPVWNESGWIKYLILTDKPGANECK